ncbi:MAG: DNA integrity scanning protein DisA nucleotide-binding domain protein [Acidimicrobiia bacterium]|nr:DNA integrity scanning protein DisA nucleotide-binding domain protein [Acidimicrobiia bacterium]
MRWIRTSTVDHIPIDPVADAMADSLSDLLSSATIELAYSPSGTPPTPLPEGPGVAAESGAGPDGWDLRVSVQLSERMAPLLESGAEPLREMLEALPVVGLAAATILRPLRTREDGRPLTAPIRRAMRDAIAAGILSRYVASRLDAPAAEGLIAETIEFLIELSSSRVESHDLTHGVVITDALADEPRLSFSYPEDVRAAKRAPLLFDGQHSVLLVDARGRARTELQRHRLDRFAGGGRPRGKAVEMVESGSLVAHATAALGGLGFYLRSDRSIWTFVDGQPLLVRRGERWRAFPFELAASIDRMIGASPAADVVVQAAFLISAQPRGAILAIVEDASALDGIVSTKDRYDLRDDIDPLAMRAETRLHHLIDADEIDERTIARLAGLDGATILDRQGELIAYGAIVSSSESQYEGARTAAARTLSESALVVLKVSVDGDITVFRGGRPITTLLAGLSGTGR